MKPALNLSLHFADARHRPLLPRHRVARWVRAALLNPGEITVRIVGADEARELN
ncbi:MAG: rRNA maturation factor, partial [Rubrivivax sp.]